MAVSFRYGAGKPVAVEVEGVELGEFGEAWRDGAGEIVEGEIEIVEIWESGEEIWDGAGEIGPAETDHGEVFEFGDGRLDVAGEVGELAEDEGLEVGEVADVRRDLSGDLAAEYCEGGDAVCDLVAFELVPAATVGLGVPRGKEIGVVEGFLDLQEDFFVIWVAAVGCKGKGRNKGREEEEEEEERGGRRRNHSWFEKRKL